MKNPLKKAHFEIFRLQNGGNKSRKADLQNGHFFTPVTSNTHPPSRLVTIDVEDNPTTVRMLHYSVPLKGALNHTDKLQTMKIVIIRSLKDILSGKLSEQC